MCKPWGAFKVRGGRTLQAGTKPGRRGRSLITSTRSHAQSLAHARAAYETPCTAVLSAASTEKVRAVRALGATMVQDGADMVGAQLPVGQLGSARRLRLVSPGDKPRP